MNILQRLISNNYEFTFHEFFEGKYGAKYCSVCCEVISGPAYIAEEDGGNNMHKSCAELPGKIERPPSHPEHDLTIQYGFNQNPIKDMICDGCSHVSMGLKFRCKICKINRDFHCISNHHHRGAILKENEVFAKYHPHKLQLLYFSAFKARDSLFCCCCLKSILDSAYVCFPCKLFVHKSCFDTIPERIESSFHPQHPLHPRSITITATKESIYCQACGERVEGVELRCQKCKYSFHVSCGKRTTPGLTLDDQEHKLFYLDYWDHTGDCGVCKNPCEGGGAICRCIQRGESFHINCILPPALNHESHEHRLTLTNLVVPRCNPNEYHCDVCEMKGDIKRHVYHCEDCYYIAHIECILAEKDPPLKIVLKNKDDSDQQNNKVQEVEAEEQIDEMQEADYANDDQEINESAEESSDDQVSEESDQESIDDESENSSNEDQRTKKLNKEIQDVKGKMFKLRGLYVGMGVGAIGAGEGPPTSTPPPFLKPFPPQPPNSIWGKWR
ncbi:hypothetical protein Ddye_012750 [Dipteronia dyeriana]|uniref:Phorbol-ester/DAG-type domain-containing protein n=1 Tax=Dipteronia dyeriana TaxID=168575 RepID=A0AAD9X4Z0_9ROSI|nr:hypothetical protein Ddye_012750 [Dipteronia dyeriana]